MSDQTRFTVTLLPDGWVCDCPGAQRHDPNTRMTREQALDAVDLHLHCFAGTWDHDLREGLR